MHAVRCPPDDDTIVNRKAIGGQASDIPFTYLDRVPKCGTEGELSGARDAHLAALLTPLIDLVLWYVCAQQQQQHMSTQHH